MDVLGEGDQQRYAEAGRRDRYEDCMVPFSYPGSDLFGGKAMGADHRLFILQYMALYTYARRLYTSLSLDISPVLD